MKNLTQIIQGDALAVLKTMPDESVDMVMTSPPYWALRDYGVKGQLGLEPTFQEYIKKLCDIFDKVKKVLKKEGTCWVNMGDTYGTQSGAMREGKFGVKNTNNQKITQPKSIHKSALMIPERFAIEMIDRGWLIRNKIIWHKKNAMPSSVLDRLNNKYEMMYFFVKSKDYFFDLDSIRIPFETKENRPDGIIRAREYGYNTKQGSKTREMEDEARRFGNRRHAEEAGDYQRNLKGKNPGDVWTLTLQLHPHKHIAMYPEKLIIPMIKAGCPKGGIVLDPFMGAGTTLKVALELNRKSIGIEINPEYIKIAQDRLKPFLNKLFND